MAAATPPPALTASDQTAEHLGRLIADAGYEPDRIGERLGLRGMRGLDGVPFRILELKLAERDTLNTLIRLFLLGAEVPDAEAADQLELGSVDAWVDQGVLMRTSEGRVRGAFIVLPSEDLTLGSDWPGVLGHELHRDHVIGDNPTAQLLENFTIPGHVGSMLDLGAGGGVQALGAWSRADTVVATDISSRAIAFARFNSALNGRPIECHVGSLFEPVAGRRFDLIVTNPPFVISPDSSFTYRDSELGGEGIAEAIIRAAPDHLADGGVLQMLCNLTRHGDDDDWEARLEALIEPTGLSAWVVVLDEIEAGEYAAGWLRQSLEHDRDLLAVELERWVGYYRDAGITAVEFCAVIARRRDDAERWFDVTKLERRFDEPAGAQVLRCFAGRELLNARSNEELLDMRFSVAPGTRLENTLGPEDDGWSTVKSLLIPEGGLPFAGNVDAHIANMVIRCNGERTLRDVFEISAEAVEVDLQTMIEGGLQVIKLLLTTGVLEFDSL